MTETPTTEATDSRTWKVLTRVLHIILAALTIVMVVVVFLQVLNRYLLNNPLSWTEEVARMLFVWITFLGAFVAVTTTSHISVATFVRRFSRPTQEVMATATTCLMIFYLYHLCAVGLAVVQETWNTFSPALNLPFAYVYAAIPVCGALMLASLLMRLRGFALRKVALGGMATAVALLLAYWLFGRGSSSTGTLVIVAVGCLVVFILLNMPIAFAIGSASLLFLILQQRVTLLIIPNRMIGGIDSFPLLAVPFFILAGELMNTGGITQRLVGLARILVGHIRGGLGMVVVVAEYFFSGISGSTVADVSAIGSLLIPAMKKANYTSESSVAIVSAASAMGILVPPCITMVVLGGMTGISIGTLFIAGFVPAVVLALCIMALVYFNAVRHKIPVEPVPSMRVAARSVVAAILPLMLPVIIFGGILSGAATATEVSVIAVLYGFLVGAFIYKEIKPKDILPILVRTVVMTGTVMFLIGASSILSWIFATSQVPQKIGQLIMSVSGSAWVFLLLSNIVFILLGAALEGLPALIILIPIFLPLLNQFGINPVHYGTLVVAALGIGVFLPPVGMGFFIACSFAEVEIEKASRAFIPYLLVLFLGLLIISYVPWFTLILPQLFFPAP
jgi:tripartite ATP-independent transporter DctM subunit